MLILAGGLDSVVEALDPLFRVSVSTVFEPRMKGHVREGIGLER